MRHDPDFNVFQENLNPHVKFDVQAAFLERPSADGLVKALSHMSLTCDPRAPTRAPDGYMDGLPHDPEIVKLQEERKTLKVKIEDEFGRLKWAEGPMKREYYRINASINPANTKRWKTADKNYRREYSARCHTDEIERQFEWH